MTTERITIPTKDFLEAGRLFTHAVADNVRAGHPHELSPMMWDAEAHTYYYEITFDNGELDEGDDEDEDEAYYRGSSPELLQEINVSDVLRETADLLLDDDLTSPLVQQLEVWLSDPITAVDVRHLLCTPSSAERVGRHVLGLAAAVLERQLQAAAGRLGDVEF